MKESEARHCAGHTERTPLSPPFPCVLFIIIIFNFFLFLLALLFASFQLSLPLLVWILLLRAAQCVAALDAFGLPAGLNLYLTAANTPVSAPPHTDKQDVFVLQTAGRKRWRVFAPPPPANKPGVSCVGGVAFLLTANTLSCRRSVASQNFLCKRGV